MKQILIGFGHKTEIITPHTNNIIKRITTSHWRQITTFWNNGYKWVDINDQSILIKFSYRYYHIQLLIIRFKCLLNCIRKYTKLYISFGRSSLTICYFKIVDDFEKELYVWIDHHCCRCNWSFFAPLKRSFKATYFLKYFLLLLTSQQVIRNAWLVSSVSIKYVSNGY